MQRIAFTMQLLEGHEAEYKKRHDDIWPELSLLLKDSGISDYSIYLEESSGKLFALLTRDSDHKMDKLPLDPLMQRWWSYMSDIMQTHDNGAPVVNELEPVFYMA